MGAEWERLRQEEARRLWLGLMLARAMWRYRAAISHPDDLLDAISWAWWEDRDGR